MFSQQYQHLLENMYRINEALLIYSLILFNIFHLDISASPPRDISIDKFLPFSLNIFLLGFSTVWFSEINRSKFSLYLCSFINQFSYDSFTKRKFDIPSVNEKHLTKKKNSKSRWRRNRWTGGKPSWVSWFAGWTSRVTWFTEYLNRLVGQGWPNPFFYWFTGLLVEPAGPVQFLKHWFTINNRYKRLSRARN